MREFIILKHNNNSLIRLLIIFLTIVLSVLISNYIKLSYLAGIAPTAIVILACVITLWMCKLQQTLVTIISYKLRLPQNEFGIVFMEIMLGMRSTSTNGQTFIQSIQLS